MLTDKNVEQMMGLLTAYLQRFEEIQQLAGQLRRSGFWRSRDGSLEVGALTAEDKRQLEERIVKDLDEGTLISATIRGLLGGKE